MGRSLLILFSCKLPLTHSFISKVRPHSREKESSKVAGIPCSLYVYVCLCVCVEGAGEP